MKRRRLALIIPALLLLGCGFRPVYGPSGSAKGLTGEIEAADPDDRNGFVFVARLEDRLGVPNAAPYILDYTIKTDREGVGITPEGATTRFNVLGRIDYQLKDRATEAVLAVGKVENFTGFSATGSIVGTISATEDASERLMVILADQLVTELIVTAPALAAMKLSPREANRHFAAPDPKSAATLIYGADPMRVAMKRQELTAALVGAKGEEEMRFTRIAAAELRKDGALLSDAMRAQSFFPGPRAVLLEDAGDGLAKTVAAAMSDWRDGDAHVIVTAGTLAARSTLRKLFEGMRGGFAVALYNDPPSREELEAELARAGLKDVDREAMTDLITLSRLLDPGDLRQTLDKLGLYKLGDSSPVSHDDVAACAPATTEAALDDVLDIVAEARTAEIGPVMQKLGGQGVQPVGLVIGATRHFRTLYAAASDPGGVSAGIARARPPVFGPRRNRMQRQAETWGVTKLAGALQMLTDTDLQLRSAGQRAPAMALVERMLIRLSMLAAARR